MHSTSEGGPRDRHEHDTPRRHHGGPGGGRRSAGHLGPDQLGPDQAGAEHLHHGHREHGGPARRAHRRHGGFGPGGFGHGGPGHGGGPGGHFGRRGRGRRTSRGDIRMAILALVAEQPRHGYEIIQAIDERSGGRWRPSPGSIYPTVAQLEDENLVDTEKVDGRRMVTLTEAGTAYVAEHRAEIDAVWDKTGQTTDEPTDQLHSELQQLIAAVTQVAAVGAQAQIDATVATLAQARKATYRLLSE